MVTLMVALILTAVVRQGVSQLTSAQQQLLLDLHNQARRNVSPTAANMEEMVWNDELAGVAQTYSEMCIFEHNNDRVSQQATFSSVGENLAITGSAMDNYEGLFTTWINERDDYTFADNSCSAVCGHYTQVVWATSSNLGCGATRCPTVAGFIQNNALLLVCNYGPAGNLIGQSPYIDGVPCSNCPASKPFCSNDLCSTTASGGSVARDPHFFLPLANGDHMCFSIQGEPNFAFNLISDKYIKLNGQFVLPAEEESHTLGNVSTFLGDLGLAIKDPKTGNVTIIKVSAPDHSVLVGDSLTVVNDKPVYVDIFETVSIKVDAFAQTGRQRDESAWLNINTGGFGMRVRFYKKHLDMFLTKTSGLTKEAHGLIGQFLTADVKIDAENMLMKLNNREPIAVKRGMAWPFLGINEECWYGMTIEDHEPEIIEGTYTDYIVEQLIPN